MRTSSKLILCLSVCAACGGDAPPATLPNPTAAASGAAAPPAGTSGAGRGGGAAGSSGSAGNGRAGTSAVPAAGSGAAAGAAAVGGAAGQAGASGSAGAIGGGTAGQAGAPQAGGQSDAGSDAGQSPMTGPDAGDDCAPATTTMPASLTLSGNLGTHDPVLIASDGRYFLFHTGRGIPTKVSSDLKSWQAGPPVFGSNPSWIANQVPGATDLWAPDISRFGDRYHLYYSASTFGSNRSCIGHATRASLGEGQWQDQGSVICSNAGGARDDWNAIDPNVVLDADGAPWLSFGSFWSGIKLIPLDAEGRRKGSELHALATRSENSRAIEAPFIVRRCGYYYLFVSFDTCCRGADSTYNIRVGRARELIGPYQDKSGMQLLRGGGSQVLQGDSRWKGPGHNAVLFTEAGAYNVYHAYAASNGNATLRISELAWDADGWPVSGGP